jgi:transglutaminase-like putative cysteine protease
MSNLHFVAHNAIQSAHLGLTCLSSKIPKNKDAIMMKRKLISILLFIPTFQMILISRGKKDFSKYLKETSHLDYNSPIFTKALSKVVREDMTLTEKLEKLYYFTRDFIPFADSASLTASGALKKNKAICYTKAMIFVSFCRRLGVPAKLALINFTVNENQKKQSHSHGIAKIFIAGK